jgi:hypothetical protein
MKKAAKAKAQAKETDSVYFLKILLYLVLGTIWIKHDGRLVIPIGLLVGVLFTRKDHFAIDRKIEYALLIVAAILGLSTQYGIYLAI